MNLEADRQQLERLLARFRSGQANIQQILELTEVLERVRLLDKQSRIGKYDGRDILEEGLKRFPNSPELTHELAKARNPYGDRNGERKLFRRAAKLYRDQGRFLEADHVIEQLASDLFAEGIEAMDSGDHHKAEQNFQRAIRVYPFHADAWIHRGILQDESGQTTEAIRLGRFEARD